MIKPTVLKEFDRHKLISLFFGAALVAALATPLFAADMTVKGDIADALYAITGDYTANKNAKLLDFAFRKVIATGEVTEKAGVKSIKLAS